MIKPMSLNSTKNAFLKCFLLKTSNSESFEAINVYCLVSL